MYSFLLAVIVIGALGVGLASVPVKLAVTVAGAVMVKLPDGLVPVKAPEKFAKIYPGLGVAVTWTCVDAVTHPAEGLVLMLPAGGARIGVTAVVKKYCVVKFALYVVADDTVMECAVAPPSDQLAHTYCTPAAPAWGVAAAIV
jgi:hypothetical protein